MNQKSEGSHGPRLWRVLGRYDPYSYRDPNDPKRVRWELCEPSDFDAYQINLQVFIEVLCWNLFVVLTHSFYKCLHGRFIIPWRVCSCTRGEMAIGNSGVLQRESQDGLLPSLPSRSLYMWHSMSVVLYGLAGSLQAYCFYPMWSPVQGNARKLQVLLDLDRPRFVNEV